MMPNLGRVVSNRTIVFIYFYFILFETEGQHNQHQDESNQEKDTLIIEGRRDP